MVFNKKHDYVNFAILLAVVLLFIEIVFFNSGIVFSLLVAGGLFYFGRKEKHRFLGKLLFWAGIIFFVISIMNMMTVKFFLLAVLIYLLYEFYRSKKNPERIAPELKEPEPVQAEREPLVRKKPLFENVFFGEKRTPEHVYEWNDVNIQTGIGDTVIDLSYTVLPRGETVIFIRKLIGNVHVLIPYDVEVNVNHSVITGRAVIFENREERFFNQSLIVQTEGYEKAEQKIKIITSFLLGDLEVRRV